MPRKPKASVAAPPVPIVQGVPEKTGTKTPGKWKLPDEAKPFMWKPGQSGNPNGRPRSTTEMKQQAAQSTDMALALKRQVTALQLKLSEMHAERANDPSLTPEQRIEALTAAMRCIDNVGLGAAQSLLDRGHGKPQQKVELDTRGVLDEMSEDDLAVFIGTMGPQVVALIQGRRKAKDDG
jgi:hypothetical protein